MSEEGGGGLSALKIFGIGCGVLALIGFCITASCLACGGAGIAGIVAASEAPTAESRAFFADVRAGSTEAAYARTSDGYRATHTSADFAAALARDPALAASSDQSFNNFQINPGHATLGGTLSGSGAPFTIELLQVGERWYVDSLIVNGSGLLP